ncbi:39S ribosomal protein L37, mitochondrial [Cephus cinctus]|uniref:Large ribosomal subunit protein mL37 n=1 Tax=Cephus cinctus TaxID=211228 RepID=A0AAJ7RGG5_CEPCN|nr:39S ribosomal protein L37, mitochondrial [Cephus cinctus]XP_015593655.1 39S ribosomal protein L37, mitochondrial [Cephus cinctus]XP_015593657.1 39S ribosomal protein L37, mitochondrial [Cephus cinctus]XP_024939961.1 39S ribosomal protein L37, mitochondrial [Cephus cinctus]
MRLSQTLFKHHLGRMIKKHWVVQGLKRPTIMYSEQNLEQHGIRVVDAKDVVNPKIEREWINIEVPWKTEPKRNNTHPDWHDRICLTFGDTELLVEGTSQAQLLLKTILFQNELPERIENLAKDQSKEVNDLVVRAIRTSNIFDAHQELLPKKKDPARPAYVFPRELGLTDLRKTNNLTQKFLRLCDLLSDSTVFKNRNIIHDSRVSVPFEKDEDLYQFTSKMETMLTSTLPLQPLKSKNDLIDRELPNMFPMHHSVGLNRSNIYQIQDLYPVDAKSNWLNAHTIFICYDVDIKNVTELPVTQDQIISRAIVKAFATAASCAKQRFGTSVKELPEPVTVQCVQSNGKWFQFLVYQLNTLNLDGTEGIRNFCWTTSQIDLFDEAGYNIGRPVLKGYNPEVFKKIYAFYNNS